MSCRSSGGPAVSASGGCGFGQVFFSVVFSGTLSPLHVLTDA